MALQILSILDKIFSSAQKQMSHTVSKIAKGFQQSVFFTSFLPGFIEKMTDKSTIRLLILDYNSARNLIICSIYFLLCTMYYVAGCMSSQISILHTLSS